MIETVEVNDLPREFTASFTAPGMEIRVQSLFEELGAYKTRWISNNQGSTSGFVMRMIGLFMPGCFKRQSLLFMRHFKAFAEDGSDLRTGEVTNQEECC